MNMTKEKLDELELFADACSQRGFGQIDMETLLSLIAAARELEERRWVPVTERLPEGDVEVLASSAYGERVMRGASNFRHLGVTHWMPLPKGPTNGR